LAKLDGCALNKRINRYSADSSAVIPNGLFWIACIGIAVCLLRDAVTGSLVLYVPWADYWEYTAVLKEWLQHFPTPVNPQVDDPSLSSRFMPYFWLLTLLGRTFNLNGVQLMAVSAGVNFVVLAVGLKLFLTSYFRHAWAPFIGVLVIFGFWGVGYNWPNFYQLRSFFYVAGYPSTFVFGLSLMSFWVTLRLLRGGSLMPLWTVLLTLAAAGMFLCHPPTGVFGIIGCGLLALTEGRGSRFAPLLALAALLVGMALAELWPFFSVWKLVLGMYGLGVERWFDLADLVSPAARFSSGAWAHPLYDPRVVVTSLGLALLGLPLLLWLFLRREHPFIVYGALLMALPYVLNLFIAIPMGDRFLLYVTTFMQLAIIWGWLQLISGWSAIPRAPGTAPLLLMSMAGGALIVAGNSWLASLEFKGKTLYPPSLSIVARRSATPDGMTVPDLYTQLLAPVPAGATVLATPPVGWPIPSIKGKVVALRNENPLLLDQSRRYKQVADFFYRPVDDLHRIAILQRYDAHYVLINTTDAPMHAAVIPWLDAYGNVVAQRGPYRMYQMSAALYKVRLPEAEPQSAPPAMPVEPEPDTESKVSPVAPSSPAPRLRGEQSGDNPDQQPEDEAAPSFGAPIAAPIVDR